MVGNRDFEKSEFQRNFYLIWICICIGISKTDHKGRNCGGFSASLILVKTNVNVCRLKTALCILTSSLRESSAESFLPSGACWACCLSLLSLTSLPSFDRPPAPRRPPRPRLRFEFGVPRPLPRPPPRPLPRPSPPRPRPPPPRWGVLRVFDDPDFLPGVLGVLGVLGACFSGVVDIPTFVWLTYACAR